MIQMGGLCVLVPVLSGHVTCLSILPAPIQAMWWLEFTFVFKLVINGPLGTQAEHTWHTLDHHWIFRHWITSSSNFDVSPTAAATACITKNKSLLWVCLNPFSHGNFKLFWKWSIIDQSIDYDFWSIRFSHGFCPK